MGLFIGKEGLLLLRMYKMHNIIQFEERVRWAKNMSCKVLEVYLVDAYLSIFNMLRSGEALSLNIINLNKTTGSS